MKRFSLLLLAGLCVLPMRAQQPTSDPETSYRAAYQFIARERWEDAFNAMRAFGQAHPQNRHADEAAFWACFSMERLPGRRAEADPCFASFIERFPQSNWRDDAEARRVQGAVQRAQGAARGAGGATVWAPQATTIQSADGFHYQIGLEDLQRNLAFHGQYALASTRERLEPSVEVLAVQALARRGNDAAVDDLRRLALESESVTVREVSIGGLGQIGTPRAHEALTQLVETLIERAAARDSIAAVVATGAVEQAARPGTNVLLPLAERYYRDSRLPELLRWSLLRSARIAETPEAQALLWRAAQESGLQTRKRGEILQWLVRSFTAEDITRIGTLLRTEPDVEMREGYVYALGQVGRGHSSFRTIWGGNGVVVTDGGSFRATTPRAAAPVPAPPTPPAPPSDDVSEAAIAQTLVEARAHVDERRAAQEQLAEQALRVLADYLRVESDARVQRAIIRSLDAPGYDVGTEGLAHFATNTGADESTRAYALEGLGRIGTEAAFAALRAAVGRDASPRLLVAGIQALVASPAFRVRADAVPDFVRLTSHSDLSVRRAAVDALGRLDAPQARQALIELIQNSR